MKLRKWIERVFLTRYRPALYNPNAGKIIEVAEGEEFVRPSLLPGWEAYRILLTGGEIGCYAATKKEARARLDEFHRRVD